MTGLETAEYLSDNGSDIIIVEMADELAPGTWVQHKVDVLPKLEEAGARFYPGWKLVEMREDSVEIEKTDIVNCRKNVPCDAIIMSLGVRPAAVDPKIRNITYKYIQVGDAMKSGRIAAATHGAYKAAMALK